MSIIWIIALCLLLFSFGLYVGNWWCYRKYNKSLEILKDNLKTNNEKTVCIKDSIEIARWNVALEDEEIQALAGGFSPTMIRPKNLTYHIVRWNKK